VFNLKIYIPYLLDNEFNLNKGPSYTLTFGIHGYLGKYQQCCG
jgi:hypothetical protein